VVIAGTDLAETREVSFEGVPAVMVSITATRVVARVPAGAATGPITVRTRSATFVTDASFVVVPAAVEASAPDPAAPPAVATNMGYSHVNVETSRGTFGVHLIKERLSEVTVRTVTANATVCRAECPAKPLADYIAENGAYAGMNGTYLCPPDYAECSGKVNSYDYAVYNSNLKTWLNLPALIGQNGLVTFAGATPTFYRRAYVLGQARLAREIPVTAGISNYPLLMQDGAIVDSEREQSDAQKQRSTKGAIGVDGSHIYLALIANASIIDSAYVLQALGVRDALNLDGGGTSAMWIGGAYKVGPGRVLPNAVLLTKP
jgi:hypothetical protein